MGLNNLNTWEWETVLNNLNLLYYRKILSIVLQIILTKHKYFKFYGLKNNVNYILKLTNILHFETK